MQTTAIKFGGAHYAPLLPMLAASRDFEHKTVLPGGAAEQKAPIAESTHTQIDLIYARDELAEMRKLLTIQLEQFAGRRRKES